MSKQSKVLLSLKNFIEKNRTKFNSIILAFKHVSKPLNIPILFYMAGFGFVRMARRVYVSFQNFICFLILQMLSF